MSKRNTNTVELAFQRAEEIITSAGYTLYDHQIEGIKWMVERELAPIKDKCGLLCDDPGLGKTIQTLALIAADDVFERNLIVCPVSLLEQWRNAARKIFPDAKIRLCHGTNGKFYSVSEIERGDHNIVIAPFSAMWDSENDEYVKTPLHGVHWRRIVIDEVHNIRNCKTKLWNGCHDIQATYRWGLSGTPIQNKVADIRSLFRYLHISPIAISNEFETLLQTYIKRRNRHILPEAYKELEIHVDDIEFQDEREQRFYLNLKTEVRKEFKRLMREDDEYGGRVMSEIFELILRLRQATIHPSLVWNGLLRKVVNDKEMDPEEKTKNCISITNQIKFWNKRPSTKIARLLRHFASHKPEDKSMIITHYTEEADLIQNFITRENPDLRVEIFDGSLSLENRNALVARAMDGRVDCLIIQIQCGGVGLNLQMFNKVYILSPDWNPSNEIQAIARCHRIGQTRDVEVTKIVVREEGEKPTIDERIICLQADKRKLMSQVLNDDTLQFNENFKGKASITSLSMKDFAFLFS